MTGSLVRLPRTVPPKVATEMILTGRRLTADEALAYGLVNRSCPPGPPWPGSAASWTPHPYRSFIVPNGPGDSPGVMLSACLLELADVSV